LGSLLFGEVEVSDLGLDLDERNRVVGVGSLGDGGLACQGEHSRVLMPVSVVCPVLRYGGCGLGGIDEELAGMIPGKPCGACYLGNDHWVLPIVAGEGVSPGGLAS
jgi:hypothetical protein